MAHTIFLKIPDVTGQATTSGFDKGEMDILNYGWGVSNHNSDIANATGASVGIGHCHEITFTKDFDAASATLEKFCQEGKHITGDVILTHVRAGGDSQAKFIELTLSGSMLTNWTISASEDGKPIESFTMAIAKYKYKTFKQKDDGSEESGPEFGWDVKTGTPV